MATITPTVHKAPYAAIDPTNDQLSQAGRTILITGGSKGIGFSIARSFAQAGACRIIIVARSSETLDTCTARIQTGVPEFKGKVIPMQCDLGDVASVESMWAYFKEVGTVVDVLVLNAAKSQEGSSILDLGWKETWELFETNTRGNLIMVEQFMRKSTSPRKAIVNVSSPFVHDREMAAGFRSYALSKSALTWALQQLAEEVLSEQTQIVSYHPGFILSEGMREAGCTQDDMDWDDENLPGNFAVWVASPKAAFLHGRFVWAKWDVEELSSRFQDEIQHNANFLQIGVHGI
ncbi:hypothetical protein N7491_011081 [Penicillium cf. griseofulvum]|uniref:Uncharacterized protein n=1 Tax=Penicillium cf. griseofulvum TaxID=2972120 RepID=A0A9W9N176_9EURO|nr:hypothetical protein N7472_001400 [Penicillium cf. griseofulvum]KAJ5422636.1 hypothetical protein N7491_011081 [Penicillium cf. griseofulvum]